MRKWSVRSVVRLAWKRLGVFASSAAAFLVAFAGPAGADVPERPGSLAVTALPGWQDGALTTPSRPFWPAAPGGRLCRPAMPSAATASFERSWHAWAVACSLCCPAQGVAGPAAGLGATPAEAASKLRRGSNRGRGAGRCRCGRDLAVREVLQAQFVAQPLGIGLLSAYFEPVLRGALSPGAPFNIPLHARPPELGQATSGRRAASVEGEASAAGMPDRAADAGALAGRGLELAWRPTFSGRRLCSRSRAPAG